MKIMNFLKEHIVLMDGAMGTMIAKKGLSLNNGPEIYNFTNEKIIRSIHEEYIEAGANIILTNTFGANNIRLKNINYSSEEVIKKAIKIANDARGERENVFIALDIGPTGEGVKPSGKLNSNEVYDIYKSQVIIAEKERVDLIFIETILDIEEAKIAIKAAKENSSLPIFCSFTLKSDGNTFDGRRAEEAALELYNEGIQGVGINCSPGPKDIYKLVNRIVSSVLCPVIVKPNLRVYDGKEKNRFYEQENHEFAKEMKLCVEVGAKIIGGCCGSTPNYIKAIKGEIEKK